MFHRFHIFRSVLKADPEARAEMLAAGCNARLTKPLNTRSLPRQLEEVITGALTS